MPALPRGSGRSAVLRADLKVDHCPECEGYWFDSGELQKALQQDRQYFALETDELGGALDGDPLADAGIDAVASERNENAHLRLQDLASGMLPLPNLWLRSAGMIVLLYGFLGLILLAIAELGFLPMGVAVAIGMGIIILQFALGPWLMDLALRWIYKFSWVPLDQLPAHLRDFVTRVAGEQNMRVPSFGLIHDGAPERVHLRPSSRQYAGRDHSGHSRPPRARRSRGCGRPRNRSWQELGHAAHDRRAARAADALFPVPHRHAIGRSWQGRGLSSRRRGQRVCPVHRQRIPGALVQPLPRVLRRPFCWQRHRQPGALASALVKIGYGLAARGQTPSAGEQEEVVDKKGKKKKKKAEPVFGIDAIGAMGIFDRKGAVAMVASSAALGFDRSGSSTATATVSSSVSKENLKSAMQWDLWNPWATFYELNSTHPLIAHRLQYLSDQAATMGQEPYVVFDRRKPESYWDDFAVDVAVVLLPLLLFLVGLGLALALGAGRHSAFCLCAAVLGPRQSWSFSGSPSWGSGSARSSRRCWFIRGDHFAPLSVTGLLTQGEGLERSPRAGPAPGNDHRQGRPRPDLVRRLRDARRDRNSVPGLPPTAADLGMALRALPRRRLHGQAGRSRGLVPALPRCRTSSSSRSPSTARPGTVMPATAAMSWADCSFWSVLA